MFVIISQLIIVESLRNNWVLTNESIFLKRECLYLIKIVMNISIEFIFCIRYKTIKNVTTKFCLDLLGIPHADVHVFWSSWSRWLLKTLANGVIAHNESVLTFNHEHGFWLQCIFSLSVFQRKKSGYCDTLGVVTKL